MSAEEKNPENLLDQAISEIREEHIDPAAIAGAADRVWARISEEQQSQAEAGATGDALRTCADYRALMPDFRARKLSSARATLLQDHIRDCPACRKALWGVQEATRPAARRPIAPVWKWAIAASVVAAAGLTTYLTRDYLPIYGGDRATVQAMNGTLYRAGGSAAAPIALGAAIPDGEAIRTAKDSGTVLRLRDGSLVEVAERTELSFEERSQGVTINLRLGSVIVQAAKQRSGHLFVSTDDCKVAVKGTIFSVNHGVKGSRVSVIEGEVQVDQGGQTTVLKPGQQHATSQAVQNVSLQDDFAWSRDANKYAALAKEFAVLRQKLEAMPGPTPRVNSRLLPYVPDGAVLYVSLPNLGQTVTEANRIFQEQLGQSPVLREWWTEKMAPEGGEQKLQEALERIRMFSNYLGDEIVITLFQGSAPGQHESPLALAETRTGFREFLEQEIKKQAGGEHIRIIADPARVTPGTGREELYVYIAPTGVVAASDNLARVQQAAALMMIPGSGTFSRTEFYRRIDEAYRGGVGYLFAGNLQALISREAKSPADTEKLRSTGFGDVRYLVVNRRDIDGQAETHATLTFSQQRRGIASWLAAPAPLRVLNHVSADASFAAAFVIKDPEQMIEELLNMAGGTGVGFAADLAKFESETGINVRADLAGPLGGEFAVALDGPLLPFPSWKLVLEVYDPARLQQAIEKLAAAVNRKGPPPGSQGLRVEREQVGSRTFYILRGLTMNLEAHYVYDGNMLIAAANRDLLLRAMEYPTTGYTLPRSSRFTAQLPRDGHTNFSGMVFHNLGPVIGPLAGILAPQAQKEFQAAASNATPTLVVVYGGPDRIELATRGTLVPFSLEHMLGVRQPGAKVKPKRLKARVG